MSEKMTKELHLKLVEAWWDGKLQFLCDGEWGFATVPPDQDSKSHFYRIRPTPKLRPWKAEEVPLGVVARSKNDHRSRTIISTVTKAGTNLGCFQTTLEAWEYSFTGGGDWKPCGVEEVEQ